MAKDTETADLFEADGVTPKSGEKKAVITPEQLEAEKRAALAEGEAKGLKEALKAAPKQEKQPAAEKTYTRAELRAQVNEGAITEDQMEEIWVRQLEAKFERKVTETVESRLATKTVGEKAGAEIDRYLETFPDINKAGTALRGKVQAEFEALVAAGADASALATELSAIKIACGPLNTSNGRRRDVDSHEDVGGAGSDNSKPDTSGWAKGLSANQKKHYESLIAKGIYKGQSDPKLVKELSYVRKAH